MVIGFQEDSTVVNARHVLKQSCIKEKELELVKLVKSRKRMLHLGNIVDAIEHACGHKPLDRFFKIPCSAALPNSSVHKLLVRFRKLRYDASKHHQDPTAVHLPVVFGKVILIDFNELSLNFGNCRRIFMIHPCGNTFRHPADDQVVIIGFQQTIVEDFLDRLFFPNALVISKQRRITSFQKLIKTKRIEVKQIDHTYWIRLGLREQCPKQASSSDDMIVACFLFEIFERIQCLRAFLHFIKDNQRIARQYLLAGDQGEQFDDPLRILIRPKNGFQLIFLIEVEVNKALIAALSKLFHEPGLTDLTRTPNNQRLLLRIILPFDQF